MKPAPLFDLERFQPSRPRKAMADRRTGEDAAAMEQLRTIGIDLAARFGLRYVALEAERPGVHEHYGICYQDGLIRIRLRHATTGRLLKDSSLVDTLCHELAHLKHFDHSLRFRRLYWRILEEARRLDYYRPGPETKMSRAGRQRSLFEGVRCGLCP